MAIQVGGTTVINDSRTLQNVGGLKTVGGTSILGSGDIATGGSTTAGAVGTYAFLIENVANATALAFGGTRAGSSLRPSSLNGESSGGVYWGVTYFSASTVSGTWRLMGAYHSITNANDQPITLWVRIS